MKKSRKVSKPRQNKVRIYADGQCDYCCNVTYVSEKKSRKPWNYPEDPKKVTDKNINKQRSLKNSLKAR